MPWGRSGIGPAATSTRGVVGGSIVGGSRRGACRTAFVPAAIGSAARSLPLPPTAGGREGINPVIPTPAHASLWLPHPLTKRLFLVDDHDWTREALSLLLELELGVEVCGTARSGEEALEALPADANLVLVDLAMHGMPGLDLVRRIRERWPSLPCIVLSGRPAIEHAVAARDAGAAAYVEKGDAPALIGAVVAVLESPDSSHEKTPTPQPNSP